MSKEDRVKLPHPVVSHSHMVAWRWIRNLLTNLTCLHTSCYAVHACVSLTSCSFPTKCFIPVSESDVITPTIHKPVQTLVLSRDLLSFSLNVNPITHCSAHKQLRNMLPWDVQRTGCWGRKTLHDQYFLYKHVFLRCFTKNGIIIL